MINNYNKITKRTFPILFFLIILFFPFSIQQLKAQQKVMNIKNRFEVAKDPQEDLQYDKIQYGEIRNQSAPIGDFLSRLWGYFGKPRFILFEGFSYHLKDKLTGLTFFADFGGSGPIYYGEVKYTTKLKPVIESFEKFMDESENFDCEIEVDTDFGIYLCGAKNGIPYDKEKSKSDIQYQNF